MKNCAKILIMATLICVALYAGIFIGRNCGGTTVYFQPGNHNNSTINARPAEDDEHLVNINTATLNELTELPGVGKYVAQNIIDYRNKYGRFLSLDELLEVKGVGESLLDQIWAYITVGN